MWNHADGCTARPSVRVEHMHKRVHGRVLRRMHGAAVREARLGWARASVGRGAWLGRDVSTVRVRDARIGCTRAKLYGHD